MNKKRCTTNFTKLPKTQQAFWLLCFLPFCVFCGESSFLVYLLTQVKTAVVTPAVFAMAAGKGLESVTRVGLVVAPVKVWEMEKGNPPEKSVRMALNLDPV